MSTGQPQEIDSAPSPSPPLIILVRPQLGENIGKAARAMRNFDLRHMRLVAPRDGWPNPDAGPAASGADDVLDGAEVFASVDEAIADCRAVYATTVRNRAVTKPVLTPEAAMRKIRADALAWRRCANDGDGSGIGDTGGTSRTAILFGPERSGLESDDVVRADAIITVPVSADFGSLNLAQAVIICAYEWARAISLPLPEQPPFDPPAPRDELDGMIEQLDAMLVKAGHYHPPERTPTARRSIRNILTRPGWSSQEVRTIRGILSSLARNGRG